jgi:hypothetical protein
MTLGSGSIGAEAARRGLTTAEIAAADREDIRAEQAKLDEEDLQEFERAEYYHDSRPDAAANRTPVAREFLGRLLDLIHPAA